MSEPADVTQNGINQENPDPAEENPVDPVVEQQKPTETVEFWKKKAREQEGRAKSNAEAAKRLQEIEDANKSDTERMAAATARAQQEAEEARSEALRYRVAASHKVGEDYFDLLGTGDEETLNARGERLSELLTAKAENEQLRAEIDALKTGKQPSMSFRPKVGDLQSGATPKGHLSESDLIYEQIYGS